MIKKILICVLSLSLIACTALSPTTGKVAPTYVRSEVLQGKRFFNDGYYKRAMRILLPLACDGSEEAQYAVGYMYYYGLGVAQDTDVGYFWIQRSACHNYYPAKAALRLINSGTDAAPRCLSKTGI